MADYTVEINLPDHKRGDRWPGIASIGPVLINGAQPTASLSRVRMHFVRREDGLRYQLDSSAGEVPNAPIVISNATTWAVNIPETQSFLSKNGEWDWDMEFYQIGKKSPLTLYKGKLTVGDDVTK
jgi:hypothetical protein